MRQTTCHQRTCLSSPYGSNVFRSHYEGLSRLQEDHTLPLLSVLRDLSKESPSHRQGQRLLHAADIARDDAAGLTDPRRIRKLAAWFDAANRTRELLRSTVRADLAVADLLLAWRDVAGEQAKGARR